MFTCRYGHSQVSSSIWRLHEDGSISEYGHLPLRDAYFAPERVEREGGIEPILRGVVAQVAQEVDLKVSCSGKAGNSDTMI